MYRRTALALAAAVLVLSVPAVAPAQLPQQGTIAFRTDRDGNSEIYVASTDGSGEINITNTAGADEFDPAWSPDGSRMAFARHSSPLGGTHILVMQPSGCCVRRVTNVPSVIDRQPAWSPAGSQIAFTRGNEETGAFQIWVVGADGNFPHPLTGATAHVFNGSPAWSPDGSKIAFVSDRYGGFPKIFEMNADGSYQHQISSGTWADGSPAWSPNGTEIVFDRCCPNGHSGIYVLNPGDGTTTKITPDTIEASHPTWSPDGSQVAFVGFPPGGGSRNIYTIGLDGAGLTQVTHDPLSDLSPAWQPAAAASPNTVLHGFAAVSSTDVWATGYSFVGYGPDQTLVEHWDGTSWSVVPNPSPGTESDFLNALAPISANDVWVVGDQNNANRHEGDGDSQSLIEHWDGTSWSVVPSPNAGTGHNILRGAAAVSTNDVWAGGFYRDGTDRTLTEHWDGSTWSVVASPNVGQGGNYLSTVAALSSDDAWAVGTYLENGVYRTLTLHWDGTSWSVVPSPSPGISAHYPQGDQLYGLATVSANDVWATGFSYDGSVYRTLTLHWDGTSWSVVPSPNVGSKSNFLRGALALGANDVWAVGYWVGNEGVHHTLTLHWDGTSWSIVPSPNAPGGSFLKGVTGLSSNDVWAGAYNKTSQYHTLIEHWDGTRWSIVPSGIMSSSSSRASPSIRPATRGSLAPRGTAASHRAPAKPKKQTLPPFSRKTTQVAPGLTLTRIVQRRVPQRIFVLRAQVKNTPLTMDVALANNVLPGFETVQSMASRHQAVAAVNGDFGLSTGRPMNIFAEDGDLKQTMFGYGNNFAVSQDETQEFLGHPYEKVTATVSSSGESWPVQRVNEGVRPVFGEITEYTQAGGSLFPPPPNSCQARLVPSGPSQFDAAQHAVVRSFTVDRVGCFANPLHLAGGVILAANPADDQSLMLRSLASGDTVSLSWSLGWYQVLDTIGGFPMLVRDGQVVAKTCPLSFCGRNPRTGVGFTSDGSVLLVVVDGRRDRYSKGMSLVGFANEMQHLGAVTAMNLDGGGSSTMVVRNKVINRPSDPGGPRHVSSALLVLNGPDPGEASFGGPSSTSSAATMAGPAAFGSWRLAARDPGSTGGLVQALVERDLWAPGFSLTPGLARMLRLYRRG